jgi:hypothetical protein
MPPLYLELSIQSRQHSGHRIHTARKRSELVANGHDDELRKSPPGRHGQRDCPSRWQAPSIVRSPGFISRFVTLECGRKTADLRQAGGGSILQSRIEVHEVGARGPTAASAQSNQRAVGASGQLQEVLQDTLFGLGAIGGTTQPHAGHASGLGG